MKRLIRKLLAYLKHIWQRLRLGDDAPVTDREKSDVREIIRRVVADAEDEFRRLLAAKGLTATTPKHVWWNESAQTFAIVEGHAPADDQRPEYLRGLNLDICTTRIRGTVVRQRAANVGVRQHSKH